MTVVVFVGPTLPVSDARSALEGAEFLPPAGAGDIFKAACRHPAAIGLVDGTFERGPSVWHKEILWAMAEGVHVFGAASMGALRAAELAPFGMEGVGRIFEAVRGGRITDDDEVAVAHAGAEHGFRPGSDAMVDVRFTLERAERERVIPAATREWLETRAKQTFYANRSYARLLAEAEEAGLASDAGALRAWLPGGRVRGKRDDALAMLRVVSERMDRGWERKRVDYRFEHTHAWESLQRRCKGARGPRSESRRADVASEALFDELRLRGRFVSARRAALARLLAIAEARQSGKPIERADIDRAGEGLRRERGLVKAQDFREWLAENDVGPEELDALLLDEARFRWVDETLASDTLEVILDYLRLEGQYAALSERAAEKRRIVESRGYSPSELSAPTGLDDRALWEWYFTRFLGKPAVPEDIEGHAARAGFRDVGAMRQAVLLEYLTVS